DNDLVLDPFSGTGTTAISAKRLGRKYIGFELDKNYIEISQQKLAKTMPNYKIGESWVSFYLNDIITIRNNDWNRLRDYFIMPEPIRAIDYKRIKIKDKKLIPSEKELPLIKENTTVEKLENKNGKKVKRQENTLFVKFG
ncbi:MAG: hypothetical protein COZ80_01470, partial [Ignavibacteria bacterium CG_4_8_14_3_um_filter_37_9]